MALILLVLVARPVPAAEPEPYAEHADEHSYTPLTISAELGWPELIETALASYPRFVELAARDEEASALLAQGRAFLSGRPEIALRYQSDSPWDDVGLREYELGLELPLWRPGQRKAAAAVGGAATEAAGAAGLALRHEVIGLLRLMLWDIERAANELVVAEDGLRIAAELETAVERRFAAGELARSETLLVRSVAMQREAEVIEAEAMLVDAERGYQSLTGLDERPEAFAEALTGRDDFDNSHPWVQLADAELERVVAERDAVQRDARGSPRLMIGPQRERGAFSDYSANSLNVGIAIPFGGKSHAAPLIGAASRDVARAQADRAQLLRELDLQLHEARHTLLVVEESLELAERRAELATMSFDMSERAFAAGEISLLELLRSEETALLTQREVVGLEVERQRAIAQINQAVGVWP